MILSRGADRDTGRRGQPFRRAGMGQRALLEGYQYPFGHPGAVLQASARANHRELLSADPARNVDPADGTQEYARKMNQRSIAGYVAEPIVDALEIVQVDDDQTERLLLAIGASRLEGEHLAEVSGVAQQGQCVGHRERLEYFVRRHQSIRDGA